MTVSSSLVFPPFRLDLATGTLWHEQRPPRQLRPQVVALLQYLFAHAGLVVTKAELLTALWPGTKVSDGLLKTYIWEIRQALEETQNTPRFIETIPRRGYRFIGKVVSDQFSVVSSQEQSGVRGPKSDVERSQSVIRIPPAPSVGGQSAFTLVGRESELTQLHNSLAHARTGERQFVFVSGEAGIGKTSLVDTFLRQVGADPRLWIARGQCIERYGTNEAYLPVLEAFGRLGRESGRRRLTNVLRKYAPSWAVQLPALINPDECERLQRSLRNVTHERMLREVADALEVLTAEQPLVLTLEDLHWGDPSSIDLISLLARRRERARLLIIGTYRPVDIAGNGHPLRAIMQELVAHQLCSELRVGPLNHTAIEEYLANRFRPEERGAEPSAVLLQELIRAIHQRTEGNPLFMVNVVDYLRAQGAIIQVDGQWDLSQAVTLMQTVVPPNIQKLIERQIEHVSLPAQRILEVASVAGVEFSAAAVASGLQVTTGEVEERCAEFTRQSLFLAPIGSTKWPDGTNATRYGFQHALYQQVLYERIPPGRCIGLHQRIGQRLEQAYGTQTQEVATELAFHFERGREGEKAVQYLHQAGENAIRRMAYTEAHALLSHGLRLVEHVPHSDHRLRQEAMLCQSLITPLLILKGYAAPEVAEICTRARELYQQLGETPQFSLVWGGLYSFYFNRAEINTACEFAQRYVEVTQTSGAEKDVVWAQMSLGQALFHAGEFPTARTYLQRGLSLHESHNLPLYASDFVQDPGVHGCSVLACTLWCLGYVDQALQQAQTSLALARRLAHPPSLAFATSFLAVIHIWRQEWFAFDQAATALTQLAQEHDLSHWRATATVLHGWQLVLQGQTRDGIIHMQRGVASLQEMGIRLGLPGYLFLLAGTHALCGMFAEAFELLDEALTVVQQTGERYNEAALHLLKGELTLQKGSRDLGLEAGSFSPPTSNLKPQALSGVEREAEDCFRKAITIAQQQQAKALELRAVMSLMRLRQQQVAEQRRTSDERRTHVTLAEAHSMLSEVYNWFTEGFATADLREAKALIEKCGGKGDAQK